MFAYIHTKIIVSQDLLQLLHLGRACVVVALWDLHTLLSSSLPTHNNNTSRGGDGGGTSQQETVSTTLEKTVKKAQQKHVIAAQRKVFFFCAWANEQSDTMWATLHMRVSSIMATLVAGEAGGNHVGAGGSVGVGRKHEGGGERTHDGVGGRVQGESTGATKAVLIEELE